MEKLEGMRIRPAIPMVSFSISVVSTGTFSVWTLQYPLFSYLNRTFEYSRIESAYLTVIGWVNSITYLMKCIYIAYVFYVKKNWNYFRNALC